jgi:hypothetical protein
MGGWLFEVFDAQVFRGDIRQIDDRSCRNSHRNGYCFTDFFSSGPKLFGFFNVPI